MNAFDPMGNTVAITIGVASASAALPSNAAGSGGRTVRVHNAGSNLIFVAFGASDVAAVAPASGSPANGIPIPAGAVEAFTVQAADTHAAVISGTAGGTAYFTTGYGV